MDKKITVTLFRPEGSLIFDVDEVTSYNKDTIDFRQREEEGDEVTVSDYTSNLPYLIEEIVTGPKDLI
jgi:hypothetical protein